MLNFTTRQILVVLSKAFTFAIFLHFCGITNNIAFAAEDTLPSKPTIVDTLPNKIKSMNSGEGSIKTKSKTSSKATQPQEKEELSPDELAERIAKKMAELHKENERNKAQTTSHRAESKVIHTTSGTAHKTTSAAMPHGANLADDMLFSHNIHWSYDGEGGPQRWGKIDPSNAKCDTGERQSPINITDGIRVDLEPVMFDYKPVRYNVIDNGHTIQVNLGAGNAITILGRRYDLTQFHFHKPSEERVSGRNYDMVMHLVHKDMDGKLVVIAVLITQGKANSLVQTIWNNMPLEKQETVQATGTIDLNQILPVNRQYYTYMGSLTTPPCTEGVLWIVFKEPIEISQEQISIFNRMYPMNARPIQPSSGRLIKESN